MNYNEDRRFEMHLENNRSLREEYWKDIHKMVSNTMTEPISDWLLENPYKEFEEYMFDRVKGQEAVALVVANIFCYLGTVSSGIKPNNNMIICAPSGCGKTETYRAVRDYFNDEIPELMVNQVDLTQITEEGFDGLNTEDIIRPFFENNQESGIGIIFLDEFDKKLLPSYEKGGSNVNLHVQSQILTLVEGRECVASKEFGKSLEGRKTNTENTLFIAMGAFTEVRDQKQRAAIEIGFGADEKTEDHYTEISREDIISYGGSYELIGRFPLMANYGKLSADIVDQIINKYVRSIQKQTTYEIHISEYARNELKEDANTEYGCRMIESKLMSAIMPCYRFLLSSDLSSNDYSIRLERLNKYCIEHKKESVNKTRGRRTA